MKIDIYDPAIYQRGVPHDDLRRLRADAPVYFHPEPGGRGFWAILKHRDVIAVSRDPLTFSSYRGGTLLQDFDEGSDDLVAQRFMMVNMDPPQHAKFRNVVKHGFTPREIQGLEPRIRARVRELLDRVAPLGECDFVRDLAALLPVEVIAEMIGIPVGDRPMVFDWSNRMVAAAGPLDDAEIRALRADAQSVAMQMWAYAGDLAQERYDRPADDLISVIMHASVDGEQITPMEFAAFFMLLVVAGNETTRNAISSGMLALMEHPAEWARLRETPSLLPTAIEEILRWTSPINLFRRTANRDVEIRGRKIREGDKVVVFYSSANRDEEVFADPYRFDLGRTPNEHLAFGIGQHMCLGASLARLEMRVFFEELLPRFLDLELCGPVRRLRSNFVIGMNAMPVRFSAEAARAVAG